MIQTIWEACKLAIGAQDTAADELALDSATISDAGVDSESKARALIALLQEKMGKAACSGLTIECLAENPTLGEVAGLLRAGPAQASAIKEASAPIKPSRSWRGSFVLGMRCLAVAALLAPAAAFDSELGFELDANGCVKNYDATTDYYPAARRAMFVKDDVGVPPTTARHAASSDQHAQLFSIEYHRTFKVVRNEKDGGVYVLHHCGTPASSITGLPADAANAVTFSVPIQEVSTDTTVTLAFLEELGLFDRLKAADMTYVTSPCLQKLAGCGDTEHEGLAWGASWEDKAAYIKAINETSELHLVGGSDMANFTKDVPFAASGDPSLLGRSEWLKFVGAFFNMEPEANRKFREIERSLYATQMAVGVKPTAPVILFVSHYKASSAPVGTFTIARPKYKLEAILKAGGRPLSLDALGPEFNPGYQAYDRETTSIEALKEVLKGVHVLVDETWHWDNAGYTMDTFLKTYNLSRDDAAYPFLANNAVLRLDATLGQYIYEGTDWFEAGVLRPDVFVSELAMYCFGLKDRFPTEMFMRNIATGEVPRVLNYSHVVDPHCLCEGEAGPSPPGPIYNDCVDEVCIIQDIATLPIPPSPPPSPTPPPSPSPPPPAEEKKDAVPGWAIAVIVVVAVLAILLACMVGAMIMREKAGEPIFQNLNQPKPAV